MNIRIAIVGLIVLLLLANIWKWWPALDARLSGQDRSDSRLFTVEDFQVHGLTVDIPSKSWRDLFHLGQGGREADGNATNLGSSKGALKQSSSAMLTPQQMTDQVSRNQIEQIKCIGVLFKENKKPEAYMVRGEQHYTMLPGDVLDGQFEVEKITIDAVYFKDRQTGVRASVPVNGKGVNQ